MYTEHQPERADRPTTSRGHRSSRQNIPARPASRRSREEPPDEEYSGRPISRVGFSPESSYRYSHDEYSRQISLDSEKQIPNSPCESPEVLYRDEEYFNNQKALYGQSPQNSPVDRLIVSPSNPQDNLKRNSTKLQQKGPQIISRQSPQRHTQSPQIYGQSPRHESQTHPRSRPSSREYLNVSPLQRDEAQLNQSDIHQHAAKGQHSNAESGYLNEGDSYLQRFTESPQYRNSPFRDSPNQYRESPYRTRESPNYGSSPSYRGGNHGNHGLSGSPEGHTRPPPAPRPKSARPKTGRKKSARVRQHQQQHRYEEQETSPPQQCDTASILNAGDPYGRPSSSLSPYKPLPAIGAINPGDHDPAQLGGHDLQEQGHCRDSHDTRVLNRSPQNKHQHHSSFEPRNYNATDNVMVKTQSLSLMDREGYYPANENSDIFSAEDIHGAGDKASGPLTNKDLPGMDVLSNFPQHLSDEIYKSSVANYERNISGDSVSDGNGLKDDRESHASTQVLSTEENYEHLSSSALKSLDFLHDIPSEPTEHEFRLLLAIKLHDGKRVQRFFRPSESLVDVMHFAENSALVRYGNFNLLCNAPRMMFTDLNVSIANTCIKDRTVLYLEQKDE
ncbi:uncharacterized protein LOC127831715 [Dreissena polymorpha]|nr:uncharacterized protein LOC127831715 [Dreissena polymorpha]